MAMRGVEKQNAITTTSAMLGVFHTDARTRHEFLELIHRPKTSTFNLALAATPVGCSDE
jgi:hypothetical protein